MAFSKVPKSNQSWTGDPLVPPVIVDNPIFDQAVFDNAIFDLPLVIKIYDPVPRPSSSFTKQPI